MSTSFSTPEPDGDQDSGSLLARLTPRSVAQGAFIVAAIGFLFVFTLRFYLTLFLLLVALIIATVTRPAVDWLARRGIRPKLGVVIVFLVVLAAITLFVALVAPLIAGQVGAVTARLPGMYADLRESLTATTNRLVQRLAYGLPEQLPLGSLAPASAASDGPSLGPVLSYVKIGAQGGFLVVGTLALALYWVLEGELITRRGLLLVRAERREQIRTVWAEMEAKIGGFFRGQLILMGVVAVLSAIGYLIVGLPYAFGLALIAGVCEAIPMIGPTVAMIPAALVAISLAPDKLVAALLVGIVVQLLENNLLVPRIMDQSVGVNPIVTILAIAAFGGLFGVAGALLAIPLAAMVQIIVTRLMAMRETAPEVGRGRVSALRLDAREIAADVRRGAVADDAGEDAAASDLAGDMLESIASDLDELLASVEATS